MRKTALQKAITLILDLEAQLRDLREAQWASLKDRAQLQDRINVLEPQLKQALQDRDGALQARDAARKEVSALEVAFDSWRKDCHLWMERAAAAERRAADASSAFDRLVQTLIRAKESTPCNS
jgi:hypothetical protein